MSVFVRLTALRSTERHLLLQAVPLVLAVRLLLWVLPSPVIIRWVRRLAGARRAGAAPTAPIATVVWAVEAASRLIPRASCLTQAVAARLLLHRSGYDSQLCVGVGGASGRFTAHAWLERGGRVLIGGEAAHGLTRLPDLSGARRPPSIAERP
jgi:hypothetical protein